MSARRHHHRRLAYAGAALAVALVVSLCPAETVITMYPGGDFIDYSPTPDMFKSETNPYPHNHIQILADRWERLHPGVRIEFLRIPSSEGVGMETYRSWCVSNFIAGTIPHIVYQNMGMYSNTDYHKGWIVPLDAYLDRPNPYAEGNGRWKDLFYQPWVDALRSADGQIYWIAPDTISVGILVNVDLMRSCGVQQIPRTFGEFVAACEKIRATGTIAYVPPYEWYADCVMPSVVWADRIAEMDVIRPDRVIDSEEIARAAETGAFSCHDDHMREYLRLIDRLYDQYPRGHHIMDALYLFRNGRIVFIEGVSIMVRLVQDDPRRDFEFQYVPYPDITAEDSPLGGHPLAGAGNAGYTSQWLVTNAAQRDGVVDLCVDWLMFLTEPANNEFLVNELGFTLPGVRGAEPVPIFKEIMDRSIADLDKPGYLDWHAFNPFTFTPEFQVAWAREKQALSLDMIDIPETMDRLEFWLQRSLKRVLRRKALLVGESAAR